LVRCVVGVDVGGTKTRVCVLDEGARVLGSGLGGPGNPNFSPPEEVRESLFGAAQAALREARVSSDRLVVGAIGGPCPPDHFEPALHAALGSGLRLFRAGEGPITLAAGSRDEHGVVVVAGTGALAWGRNRRGESHVASGWGGLLGDEGSGYDIAVRGLRAACRAVDGRGPTTSLVGRYLDWLGTDDLRQIVGRVYGGALDRRAIAAMCPFVFDAAHAGDAVAGRILGRAGTELALSALTCVRALGMDRDKFDVVASGGVLRSDDFVLPRVRDLVGRRCPGATLLRPKYEPAVGAALVALKSAGIALDDASYARLDSSLNPRGDPASAPSRAD